MTAKTRRLRPVRIGVRLVTGSTPKLVSRSLLASTPGESLDMTSHRESVRVPSSRQSTSQNRLMRSPARKSTKRRAGRSMRAPPVRWHCMQTESRRFRRKLGRDSPSGRRPDRERARSLGRGNARTRRRFSRKGGSPYRFCVPSTGRTRLAWAREARRVDRAVKAGPRFRAHNREKRPTAVSENTK